jgi:hypothetical protein
MLLFPDDMLIIQEHEYTLQKSTYKLQKLSNNFNFNISTTKKSYGFSRKVLNSIKNNFKH